jgi:multiple sugar transport system permease protein
MTTDTFDRGILSKIELRSTGGRIRYILLLVALTILALIFFFPIYFAFVGGMFSSTELYRPGFHLWPANANFKNYVDSIVKYNLLRQFLNTFIIVGGGVILQMVVSTLAAYSLARLKPLGGRIIQFGMLITLLIPSIAYIIPLYRTLVNVPLLNISLLNTYWGLWLPYSLSAFAILVLKDFFQKIPAELYDAAKIEGASALDLFLKFTLPLSRSIIAVLSILAFVNLWKDFLLPYLVLPQPDMQPITVRLWTIARYEPLNLQMAASFVAMVPPLVIAILLQRFILRGVSIGAVKG